jgi:NAD(P)-dependent dehydrogenase (short-subunit alcohol dehydrogenase family)
MIPTRDRVHGNGAGQTNRLDGKVAWIIGAASGIGEAATISLADEGATVVLTGRRRDRQMRLVYA